GAALGGGALVVLAALAGDGFEGGAQQAAVLGVELAGNPVGAPARPRQVEPAPLVLLGLGPLGGLLVGLVAELLPVVVEAVGILAPCHLEQGVLGGGGMETGLADLVHGPADDADVLGADLAAAEGGGGGGQLLELASGADAGVGGAGGEAEVVLEP